MMNIKKAALTAAAVLLTLCLVAGAALAPVLLFRLEDSTLFQKNHPSPVEGGALSINPQDIPLVRALRQYSEAQASPAELTVEDVEPSPADDPEALQRRLEGYITALEAAGVLPYEIRDCVMNELLAGGYPVQFSRSVDSRGFEQILCQAEYELPYPDAPSQYYIDSFTILFIVEMNSDTVIKGLFYLPRTPETPIFRQRSHTEYDRYALLDGYLGYLGLAYAGDWNATPNRVAYEGLMGDLIDYYVMARSAQLQLVAELSFTMEAYFGPNFSFEVSSYQE